MVQTRTSLAPMRSTRILELAFSGEVELACSGLRAIAESEPAVPDHWCHLGIAHAIAAGFDAAVVCFERALALDPRHVVSLAYLGIVAQKIGALDRAEEILDYSGAIIHGEVRDSAGLNEQLREFVSSHESLTWELAGKATRNGWQTSEFLRDTAEPARRLKQAIEDHIAQIVDYDEGLESLQVAAWAVVLGQGGFQEPHVHPAGLLSGVYYVDVPMIEGSTSAFLQFTRSLPWLPPSPFDSALAHRLIGPHPGEIVVFPSHYWHATVPNQSSARRMSIAFDVSLRPR